MIANHSADNHFPWPEEAVSELRRLHDRGDTSSQIAETLSAKFHWPLSRNAIIGKRMRMGMTRSEQFLANVSSLQNTRRHAQKRADAERQQKIADRAAARQAMQRAADEERQRRALKPKEDNVIEINARIHPDSFAVAPKTMMDPAYCGCKWGLERTADDGSTLFCCNATPDRLDTYCPDHKRRAYQRSRTPAQIKADQAIREVRIANARAMGLRQAFDFRAKRRAAR